MINWTKFEQLPGSQELNFESLCRSLIRLHYSQFGKFGALANQPGVEFHLQLHTACPSLGAAGNWFGWQCKWYDLPPARALGKGRRDKIEKAISLTEKELPKLTDWVLWTRYKLTKADQKWFRGLKTKMRLDMKTTEDVEMLLNGPALHLKDTYFGELILTPKLLSELHSSSIAPISKRWLPEAHQPMRAERSLRRMLGEAASWDELHEISERLIAANQAIEKEPLSKINALSALTPQFSNTLISVADTLTKVHQLLAHGDFDILRIELESQDYEVTNDIDKAPRLMRGARLACGLYATNALADLHLAIKLLSKINSILGVRLIGVVAGAGTGKTQLAAELTASCTDDRPAGILLRGSELHSGRTIDTLAQSIKINGKPVPSIDALLAALDAAGERAKRRLPLIIDGLNEAENPTDWKSPLSSLAVTLDKYANVLVICTVRPGVTHTQNQDYFSLGRQPIAIQNGPDFAKQSLPDDIMQIELTGFDGYTEEAIQRYFQHYLINSEDADLPIELLSHPLTLRIFCEATNADRKKEVGIESIPGSLSGLFEKYIDKAAERIAELSPRRHRFYEQDVRQAIDLIGYCLWESNSREIPLDSIKSQINDDQRDWDKSIAHLLEQEGLILFVPGKTRFKKNIIPVYDAIGGHMVASSLLAENGHSALKSWLNDKATIEALDNTSENSHPFASDIFTALVSLVPQSHRSQQLWQITDEPFRSAALRIATNMEGNLIDASTVDAISNYIKEAASKSEKLFLRLYHTRSSTKHPLNADFLDSVLRSMSMSDRDLKWTEWVRENAEDNYGYRKTLDIYGDISQLEAKWRLNQGTRTPADQLRAKWLMWLLTTTIHNLRDRVTRALYWFGRGSPDQLFEITLQAASINDPYIFERMLAASYGVAMACQHDSYLPDFRTKTLGNFAKKLFELIFSTDALAATSHILTREYGRRLVELTLIHNNKLLTAEEITMAQPPFSNENGIAWQDVEVSKERIHGDESPFRMDFENYTLGSLSEGRGNYNYNHPGYQKIRSQVLWRVEQLGWTSEYFGKIDRVIGSERHRYGQHNEEHYKVDRYGKKYSWIAYFELQGWLIDNGLLTGREDDDRTWDVDIDPSFPNKTEEVKLISDDYLGEPALSLREWITDGPTPNFTPYLKQNSIYGEKGPWVALDGYVNQEDEARGRKMFGFVRSFLVPKDNANSFSAALRKQPLGGRWLPEKPRSLYAFSGEIPWCNTIPTIKPQNIEFAVNERKVRVKRKRQAYFLNDQRLNLSQIHQMRNMMMGLPSAGNDPITELSEEDFAKIVTRNVIEEVEEVEKEYNKFKVLIPVHDFDWEARNIENESIQGICLAKQLAQKAGLIHLPNTHDLQKKDGTRATYGISKRPRDLNNTEQFFFIRKDILQSLLEKLDMSLVWAVWGERELSYKQMDRARPDGDLAGLSHGDFKEVIRFK
ncbi:NACHT domain-containing protein [Coraliomargarita sp. W4R53]